MTISDTRAARVVEEFAALSPADRRAVSRLLSAQERKALRQFANTRGRAPAGAPSAWLTKRIMHLIGQRGYEANEVTEATRRAIRDFLGSRSGEAPRNVLQDGRSA